MAIEKLCPPAAIFLVFMVIQISVDITKGYFNSAMIKAWVGILLTILLNYLCNSGLGVVSWFFVFIPFVFMTVIISILLLAFNLNPKTGKIRTNAAYISGSKKHSYKTINIAGTDGKGNTVDPTRITIRSEVENT